MHRRAYRLLLARASVKRGHTSIPYDPCENRLCRPPERCRSRRWYRWHTFNINQDVMIKQTYSVASHNGVQARPFAVSNVPSKHKGDQPSADA